MFLCEAVNVGVLAGGGGVAESVCVLLAVGGANRNTLLLSRSAIITFTF